MERASNSKKAMKIETTLLNKIAMMGQGKFAAQMGIHESRISKWKHGFFQQVSMMLAILEYGVEDEELNRLAKSVAELLINGKAPECANTFEA
ncbi:hypothetical protein RSJ44_004667 [Yersinia enterocolitica]|uniref:CII family transcriptional regulator n=1 Tax=Yersinia enterocolitica TaxID=630 RepID=UPI0002EF57AD|nr:CII family transcriptional regulator [Yersinia enterocolitica]EKN3612500.1 hypothetical protein [Yersinia enterocolitica]EKN3948544.1 hypothetical protein [Yersinia enterocolitica]EKN3982672.1 hypothetical protein [Yersinia enterocolitica]EKN3987069.1 hypothetical protein [Yersinia enterocolitica]EKN4111951.1 hypothetical protein [Yersinia enterocolitica]